MKKSKPTFLCGNALYVATIAEKLFMRPSVVAAFVEENAINALQLMIDVGSRRINSMDVTCAMIGERGNPFFVSVVQAYSTNKA